MFVIKGIRFLLRHFYLKARSAISQIKDMALMAISVINLKAKHGSCRQLEIGSGPAKRDGWITLDGCKGADVFWDLRYKLPFEDSCLDRVYCSHVLEHFSYHDLKALLLEMHRVLRPGGKILIAVPDASIYVKAYLGERDPDDLLKFKPAVVSTKPMDILNYIFYMDGHHKFMFDAENLSFHCEAAGFINCMPRPFDQHLDMAARDYQSIYISCQKPGSEVHNE